MRPRWNVKDVGTDGLLADRPRNRSFQDWGSYQKDYSALGLSLDWLSPFLDFLATIK